VYHAHFFAQKAKIFIQNPNLLKIFCVRLPSYTPYNTNKAHHVQIGVNHSVSGSKVLVSGIDMLATHAIQRIAPESWHPKLSINQNPPKTASPARMGFLNPTL